uniref:Uncharacterized protein n=1 Tax=Panagrolaimus superbus TaxID=310955 RepID=A0A914Z3H8_9BILA
MVEKNDGTQLPEKVEDEMQKIRIERLLKVAEKVLKENKERCLRSFAFYFFILIIFGIPLWWITTSPYRASLERFSFNEAVFGDLMDDQNSEKGFRDNSPDVWNEISISAAYNIHLIFVHEENDNSKWSNIEKSIVNEVNKMVNYLSDTVFFSVTTEHFWDLYQSDIFSKKNDKKLVLNGADMTRFITAIDKHSSPIISTDPLLKLVFVLTNDGIEIDGIQSNGQTFASWGSIINASPGKSDDYLNAIYESFHSLLGAQLSSRDVPSTFKHPDHAAWNNFRHRAFSENIHKAEHFITAINTLASKMPQLVITPEVGELVRKSKNFVKEAIAEEDALKASVARLLAERAADHSSLIGTGDLTSSLKIGIYVPIGMPLLLPVIEVLLRYSWGRYKNRHIKVE